MNKKRILTAAVSLSLVAVVGIGATLAYFTDKTEVATNVFTTGNVNVSLIDQAFKNDSDATWTFAENGSGYTYSNIMPGDKLGKNVAVQIEDGSQDCYVAVRVQIKNNNDSEGLTTDMSELYQQVVDASAIHNWLYAETGDSIVLYYPTALTNTSAENIAPLFSYLTVPKTWSNEYLTADLNINVQAAAVQAVNLGAPTAVAEGSRVADTTGECVIELNKLLFAE